VPVVTPPLPVAQGAALLRTLAAGGVGIRASRHAMHNYGAVFARDAIMAGIAGVLTGDAVVAAALGDTLRLLGDHLGAQGQVPSNVLVPPDGSATRVSFGTLAPRLDSATWFLVGAGVAVRAGVAEASALRAPVARVAALLDAIEYNGRHLLYVPAGGNWADEYPYDGYILYDQVLRAWGLRVAGAALDAPALVAKGHAIGEAIAAHYWPDTPWRYAAGGDGRRPVPLASFAPGRTDEHVDLAACALLALADVAPPLGARALDGVLAQSLDQGRLPAAFAPVIAPGDPEWPALAGYHLHGFRNHPHEYHNGGVWPVWLGWLALALVRHGRVAQAAHLRERVAGHLQALAARGVPFDFEEFFHGADGRPLGMPGMAYTATGLLLLEYAATRDLSVLCP
jgi:hypothetical protein